MISLFVNAMYCNLLLAISVLLKNMLVMLLFSLSVAL